MSLPTPVPIDERVAKLIEFVKTGADSLFSRAEVEAAIKGGISPDARDGYGNPLLHIAVHAKQPSMVRFLLRLGANINLQDVTGCTALHWAALAADCKSARILLEDQYGMDMEIRNHDGKTAREFAKYHMSPEMVQLFNETEERRKAKSAIKIPITSSSPGGSSPAMP